MQKVLFEKTLNFRYLKQTRKVSLQTLVNHIFVTLHCSKARVTFAYVSFTLIISSHLALGPSVVRSSPLAFCLFISLVLSSVFSSLPVSPPPPRSGLRLFVACLHLFSEHQAQLFSHWAAYGATATHTTLTLHPSPVFRQTQYFFPGFKRDFAVGFQTSRVTGLQTTSAT